jgi:adenylate cyclase
VLNYIRQTSLLLLFALFAVSALRGQGVEELERSVAEADHLLQQAEQAGTLGRRKELAEQSLKMARDLRHDGAIVRAAMLLGATQMRLGESADALESYLVAESRKSKANLSKATLTEIYAALGDLFFGAQMFQNARLYYAEGLKLQPRDFALMEKMAEASLAELHFDTAEMYYNPLITKYRQEGDFRKLIQVYQKMALAHERKGDVKGSLSNYMLIADIIEREGNYEEEASLYNNLGRQYTLLRAYDSALRYFRLAEDRCSYIACEHPELLWANMGVALHNTGDSKQGIVYLLKARAILLRNKDQPGGKVALASLEHLLAGVHLNSGDTYTARTHISSAIALIEKDTTQARLLASVYEAAANIHQDLYEFEKAFEYYRLSLELQNSLRSEAESRQQEFNQQRGRLAAAEGQTKYDIVRLNLTELAYEQEKSEKERLSLLNEKLVLVANESEARAQLLAKQKLVDSVALKTQQLEAFRLQQEARLAAQNLAVEKQERVNAELRRQVELDRAHSMADSVRSAQENEILRRDRDISDLRYRQQARLQKFGYWLGSLLLLIMVLLGAGFMLARRTGRRLRQQNQQIQAQNAAIQEERSKSDRLLTNILPEEIAEELKARGFALPRTYDSATVLFTDFVNFTKLSARLSPERIIDELNECFLAFDEICDRHNLEKIKTIGDAFMCAGGLPVPNDTHPQDAVRAALDMVDWLENRRRDNPDALLCDMRIGIHTGPVVAGVVGKNKFAFDIWGDAVNLAARLEEHGVAGKVNISKATAEAVEGQFHLSYRGQEEVHNKGAVEMYFVER